MTKNIEQDGASMMKTSLCWRLEDFWFFFLCFSCSLYLYFVTILLIFILLLYLYMCWEYDHLGLLFFLNIFILIFFVSTSSFKLSIKECFDIIFIAFFFYFSCWFFLFPFLYLLWIKHFFNISSDDYLRSWTTIYRLIS